MAKQQLPTNFKDDILATQMAGKRRYRIIQNDDGTVSLEDVTDYSRVGNDFGSVQINATNMAVNESFDKNKVIDSLDDIAANESAGYAAGALAVRELNGKITEQNTLWDGFLYMQGGQEVKLSTPIDQTKSGIVLVWSFVENEKAQDYAWHSCFVPKALVESRPGDGHQFNLFWNTWSQKYLYIHNDKIVGQTTNSNTQNKRFGLRKIIAV